MTLKELLEAVNEFFSDTTRSASETLEGLEEVRDEIETLIESLDDDGDSDEDEDDE